MRIYSIIGEFLPLTDIQGGLHLETEFIGSGFILTPLMQGSNAGAIRRKIGLGCCQASSLAFVA
jgi:hypothetical protein